MKKVIIFDLLRIFVADDKEIRIEGNSTTLFLSIRFVQGQKNDVGTERLSRSEFIEVNLHSIENRFGRENLIFP